MIAIMRNKRKDLIFVSILLLILDFVNAIQNQLKRGIN